ncbi:MAG: ATP-binding protein [Roseiflexaceae bacterium]|nr:ATP-binding protein [Roseiflexaceae bacterium]
MARIFLLAVFVLALLWSAGLLPALLRASWAVLLITALRPVIDVLSLAVTVWPLSFGMALGVAFGVAAGAAAGVALGVAFGVAIGMTGTVAAVAFGLAISMAVGVTIGVDLNMVYSVTKIMNVLRIPFWLIELPWMLLIALRARSDQDAARLIPWLPPRFDEVIVLPLPFLDEIIARAYRANQAAARETLGYLITRTNQQKAARRAIVAIAIDALERCATTDAIGAIADDLAWIPNPPPKELGGLPRFLEIAQDVRAAVQATSLYRQRELLAVPLQRLKRMREGMAFDAAQAARFGAAVDRWQAILETAMRTLEEGIRQAGEIPQVYIAGPPLDPDLAETRFKGRVDVFREIEALALAPQRPTLLLHGGRRVGKTSTLNYLPRRVGSGIVPLFVDAQGLAVAQTMSGLARELARQMIESARRARNLSLPQPDDAAFERDPFAQVLEWMRQVERACGDRTLLLCLDEFEKLEEIVHTSNTRAPLHFLRHVMQHRPRWTLLFAGMRPLEELSPLWSDYLIHARAIRLSFLHEADARELIVQPVPDFPDIYDPAAVECIIRETRCQPYLVQLVCTEIVNLLNRERRGRAVAADVDAAVIHAFETGAPYFREFWQSLSDAERRALRALAHTGTPPDDVSPAMLAALVRREVLRAADGTYAFQVPMVRRWVRERSDAADPP